MRNLGTDVEFQFFGKKRTTEVPMSKIAGIWSRVQRALFHIEDSLPQLTAQHKRLIEVLEVLRIEVHVPPRCWQRVGRKPKDRRALARAFVAKALYNLPQTNLLIARLKTDRTLRQICGWEQGRQVPSESTFSRAFAQFAQLGLTQRVHASLVTEYCSEQIICHVARDSTDIEAREKPKKKQERRRYRPGRPGKGEVRPPASPNRLTRQYEQSAAEAIAELPTACDVGTKKNSKGKVKHWVGYKFHVDIGDGGLPLAAVTTSASLHDSQVAIPLMKLTASRVTVLYELMDSAYDAALIHQCCRGLDHVPIIEGNPRRGVARPMEPDRVRRYRARSQSERFHSDLKDNHGGRMVRVRGHPKVESHLMFGLLVVFAKTLLGLI